MSTVSALDEHLRKLHVLQHRSVKILDKFAEHSETIATRADRIRWEVQPFQVALANVQATKDEAEIAVTFHSIPHAVKQVLRRENESPRAIVAAMKYLVSASEYISTNSDNAVSENVLKRLKKELESIVKIAEARVSRGVLEAMCSPQAHSGVRDAATPRKQLIAQRSGRGTSDNDVALGGKWQLVHDPHALEGLDDIVRALNASFDRRQVATDVKHLCRDHVFSLIDASFSAAYHEEYETAVDLERGVGGRGGRGGAGTGMAIKGYQPGAHALLEISAGARRLLAELSALFSRVVLEPLERDFAVAGVVPEIAVRVVDRIFARAEAACAVPRSLIRGSATQVFLASGGGGLAVTDVLALTPRAAPAGPTDESNYTQVVPTIAAASMRHSSFSAHPTFRDLLFVGLDLLTELWQWIDTAGALAGDAADAVQHVDAALGRYITHTRQLFARCSSCHGYLDAEELLALVSAAASFSGSAEAALTGWLPSVDCAPHESTINLLHLLRTIFTTYFGPAKIVLCEGIEEGVASLSKNPIVEQLALEGLKEFADVCVEGHIRDLAVVGNAAATLQRRRQASAASASASAGISGALFELNNVCFFSHHLSNDACFAQRRLVADAATSDHDNDPDDDDDDDEEEEEARSGNEKRGDALDAAQHRRSGRLHLGPIEGPPVLHAALEALEAKKEELITCDFSSEWLAAFPLLQGPDADPALDDLAREHSPDRPLTKPMRMAVKRWYDVAVQNVLRLIFSASFHSVWAHAHRQSLRQAAEEAVGMGFDAIEAILAGREWSTRPKRHITTPIPQLLQRAASIY